MKVWQKELAGIVVGVTSLLLLGRWSGHLLLPLLASVILYLSWHLFQLYRLTLWLGSPKHQPTPYPIGIWRIIIKRVDDLRQRGRRRKRKLSRMLSGFLESTGALPDATVVLDDEGSVEWWNSVASEMLGLKRQCDKGTRIETLIHDPVFLTYLSGGDYSRPLQMPAPVNDSISLEVRIVPYGKGKRLLQARDITRLNQLETVRRDFVANVSHEVRTPLTVLHGYLETMLDAADTGLMPWISILGQMQQQSLRMQSIVDDLLLLSRLETGEGTEGRGVVNVKLLLQCILEEARQVSGKQGHQFTLKADKQLMLSGFANELESAFSNLIFNAVRYTPAGGRIDIRWCLNGSGPRFSVTDTGIGIEPEHIPRLTERFYRIDVGRSRQSGGTGLGLAIVKHVLTRHGGRLEVESQPGSGSTFSCFFPHSRAAS
ncbi:phosphate regulon sensor histidine kinase PhoR [Candidatus Vondammii sp. HM_W22]|uniref:phosphate regulon sensor histidine kinase PhoR n=1 Tax=Candidatus Vondammii sp. HM_W22 TaxID=2687299 RepID=UPI001F12B1A2|nr:phosphate regulon sensor histidine kinase PhoR [Candidatus Vondammii sp. HM_W22]